MDPLEVLDKLNTWRRDWQEARDSRVRNTLRLSRDACYALVEISDVRSDTAVLLHERVKSLYQGAASVLGARLQNEDLEIVMLALASARMYYWIRFLNGSTSDELESLIRRRLKIYGAIPSSLGAVEFAFNQLAPNAKWMDGSGVTTEALDVLRHRCLEDFAGLDAVVDRYDKGVS